MKKRTVIKQLAVLFLILATVFTLPGLSMTAYAQEDAAGGTEPEKTAMSIRSEMQQS